MLWDPQNPPEPSLSSGARDRHCYASLSADSCFYETRKEGVMRIMLVPGDTQKHCTPKRQLYMCEAPGPYHSSTCICYITPFPDLSMHMHTHASYEPSG